MALSHPVISVDDIDIEASDNLQISRSLDTHASEFSWTSPDYNNPETGIGSPLRNMFSRDITISLDGEVVFRGYVETLTPKSTPTVHSVTVAGRSRTADIIDSSAPTITQGDNPPTEINLGDAVARVNDGLGFVTYTPPSNAFLSVTNTIPALTERVSAYIDRLAQQRQLVVTDNERGELLVLKPEAGEALATLEHGDGRLLSATARYSTERAFAEYIVVGYAPIEPDDDAEIPAVRATEVSNLFPGRKRRIRVAAPQEMDEASAQAWISHEARRTIAATYALEVTVAGWRNEHGDLYKVGQIYQVVHPHLYSGLGRVLMVGAITYQHSISGGQTCTLGMSSPLAWVEGYIPLPETDDQSEAAQALAEIRGREEGSEQRSRRLSRIREREEREAQGN